MARLLKDRTARVLGKVIKERELQPRYDSGDYIEPPLNTNLKSYVVVLTSSLAPATNNMDGTWTIPSSLVAKVYERPDTKNNYSPDVSEAISGSLLLPSKDLLGNQLYRRVFNYSTQTIAANTPTSAIQDTFGDLYIINPSSGPTTGTPFYNASNETVPPFGVMQFTGGTHVISGVTYYDIAQPGYGDGLFAIQWLINRSEGVAAGDTGRGDLLKETVGPVIMGSNTITVYPDQELGPKPNSWGLWPSRQGFMAVGGDYDNIDGLVHATDCIQRPVTHVFGRLYTQLTQNANGNAFAAFEIWSRDVNTGIRFPAGWSFIYTYAPLLNNGDVAKAGTFGFADLVSIGLNIWEGDFACDPDNSNSTQQPYGNLSDWQDFIFTGPDSSSSDIAQSTFF